MEGINQPPSFNTPRELVEIATTAENLGLYSLWTNDHVAPWPKLREAYDQPINWYESLISIACVARLTTRIKLALGVIVVPLRDPVLLAKQVSTLDLFSDGRVLFGVGLGTTRDEFTMLRPRDAKVKRGEMLDEALEVIELLLNQPEAGFSGKFYEFEKLSLDPKPMQKPLPIYVAGHGPATLGRIARYGAGFMTSGGPWALKSQVDALRAELDKTGRDLSEIDVVFSPALRLDTSRERAVEKFMTSHVGRRMLKGADLADMDSVLKTHLVGTPEEVAESIRGWANAGATHCAPPNIAAETYEEFMEQMHIYANEVVPLV